MNLCKGIYGQRTSQTSTNNAGKVGTTSWMLREGDGDIPYGKVFYLSGEAFQGEVPFRFERISEQPPKLQETINRVKEMSRIDRRPEYQREYWALYIRFKDGREEVVEATSNAFHMFSAHDSRVAFFKKFDTANLDNIAEMIDIHSHPNRHFLPNQETNVVFSDGDIIKYLDQLKSLNEDPESTDVRYTAIVVPLTPASEDVITVSNLRE